MGENVYKAFKMNYTWEAQEKKMLDIYEKLIGNEGEDK